MLHDTPTVRQQQVERLLRTAAELWLIDHPPAGPPPFSYIANTFCHEAEFAYVDAEKASRL